MVWPRLKSSRWMVRYGGVHVCVCSTEWTYGELMSTVCIKINY